MKLVCFIFGRKPRIRRYWQSRRMKGLEARCECTRCGAALTDYSTPPR